MTSKGQLTVPKPIRDRLKLKTGDKVAFELQADGSVKLRVRNLSFRDVFGMLASETTSRRPLSIEEMDAGVAKAIKKKFPREGRPR